MANPSEYCLRAWSLAATDSLGRTRALFTSSAGNEVSNAHIPASFGLSNIVSLTYSDNTDTVQGNKG